jgi:histidinol-phosphate/aromatic aminotransferase/cobyric acid decarboxylase-like protein
MDMTATTTIHNYTKDVGRAGDNDRFSGTLSPAALQTIMEYTTRPGDVVVTFTAQFGAIYTAAQNCGRTVFGTESFAHFGDDAERTVRRIISREQKTGKKRRMANPASE